MFIDLLKLVEIVEEGVLGLVNFEDIRVCFEKHVQELFGWDYAISDALLGRRACLVVISRQAHDIKLLKWRDLR